MSTAPIRFTGREKEAPFDAAVVQQIILNLLTQKADDVESEQLEIKSWCENQQELSEKLAEASACLSNTSGGYVLVGVEEGITMGRKFSACPYPGVTTLWLQQSVHDLTRPPLACTAHDVSGILTDINRCHWIESLRGLGSSDALYQRTHAQKRSQTPRGQQMSAPISCRRRPNKCDLESSFN